MHTREDILPSHSDHTAKAKAKGKAKAKVDQGLISTPVPNKTRPPTSRALSVLPLSFLDLLRHERVQACLGSWSTLGDSYVYSTRFVEHFG